MDTIETLRDVRDGLLIMQAELQYENDRLKAELAEMGTRFTLDDVGGAFDRLRANARRFADATTNWLLAGVQEDVLSILAGEWTEDQPGLDDVGYLAGLDEAPCPLCGGTGIWIHSDGAGGGIAEVCPRCDEPPVAVDPDPMADWSPARLALAEEASVETERYFDTLTAFCRGLMSYSEWAKYLDERARRIADWYARRTKEVEQ